MNDERLTILVTSRTERIPVGPFLSVVTDTLAILHDIDAAVSGQRRGLLNWRIADMSLSSPLGLTMVAESEQDSYSGREVITACTEGIRQLQSSAEAVPQYFSDKTLEQAKHLVSVLNGEIESVRLVAEWTRAAAPDQSLAANVDALLPKEHDELGTLVGKLEMLSMHERTMFAIWEVISGARIECYIPEERLDEAHEAFGRRVSVSGKIRYSKAGQPIRIHVEELRALRPQEELPQLKDLEGISITGDVDPTDYIRGLRDAE